jgi:GR25 family glycosyltransferase involved in LPS biosynthesis
MKSKINLNEHFDAIFCINLKRRKDRRRQFLRNKKNLNYCKFEFFEAIEGNSVIDPEWGHNIGALGCRLSHLSILKTSKEKKYNSILVFEDDAKILSPFLTEVDSFFKVIKTWDMIYFGGSHFRKPTHVHGNIFKLENTLQTHAIAIHSRVYDDLIEKIERDKRWVDSVIADLHPNMNAYGFIPNIVVQRNSFSDIENKYFNHSFNIRVVVT